MESSSFLLHNQLLPPPPPLPSSSLIPLYSRPRSVLFHCRNADASRLRIKLSSPIASLYSRKPHPQEFSYCTKKALPLFTISPFFPWRDKALEGLASGEADEIKEEGNQKQEGIQKDVSSNPFLAFLSVIRKLSILGAFYALVQKDKNASEAAIESLKAKLDEKDGTNVSMKNYFESKLLHEQEEWNKLLGMAEKEQLSLVQQLNSTNSTIKRLEAELQSDKRRLKGVIKGIVNLQSDFVWTWKDKCSLEGKLKEKDESIAVLQDSMNLLSSEIRDKEDAVHSISSSLSEKDLELENLNSAYLETLSLLAEIDSEVVSLMHDITKTKSELEEKISAADELNATLNSSNAEQDDFRRRCDALQQEYNDLKSSSEKRAASDAELLVDRVHKLHELIEKYELAENEASLSKTLISELTEDRNELQRMLQAEENGLKNLRDELQVTEEELGKAKNEASELTKELKQSSDTCLQLRTRLSGVQAEFSEVQKSLEKTLGEAVSNANALTGELTSEKEFLKSTQDELQVVSTELKAATETRDSLKKQLIDVNIRAESAIRYLNVVKTTNSNLNKEKESLKKQMSKDKEARNSLERDLDEVSKSLDQMNKHVTMLSTDVEMANFRISSLEEEKGSLSVWLEKQKKLSRGAREDLKGVHNLVTGLGNEKENLAMRARMSEDDLALAGDEILRLKNQSNSSEIVVDSQPPKEAEPDGSEKAVPGNQAQEKAEPYSSAKTVRSNQALQKTEQDTEED